MTFSTSRPAVKTFWIVAGIILVVLTLLCQLWLCAGFTLGSMQSGVIPAFPFLYTPSPTVTPTRTPTCTPIEPPTPLPLSWELNIQDDFSTNDSGWPKWNGSINCGDEIMLQHENTLRWVLNSTSGDGCFYQEIAYKIPAVSDFDMAVDLFIVSATTMHPSGGGLLFRDTMQGPGYIFMINDQIRMYNVAVYYNQVWYDLIPWRENNYIRSGQVNRLKVSARGAVLTFYINGHYVGRAYDETILTGRVGVAASQFSNGIWNTFEYKNFELHAVK